MQRKNTVVIANKSSSLSTEQFIALLDAARNTIALKRARTQKKNLAESLKIINDIRSFMNSKLSRLYMAKWNEIRQEALIKYGRTCLKCGSTENICVDHIKPKYLYPKLRFDINNLQPLCWPCNKSKGMKIADYRSSK